MPPSAHQPLSSLRRTYSALRWLALLEMAAALCLFPLAMAATRSYVAALLVLPLAGLYAWRWIRRFKELMHRLRQLRLEERFLSQNLDLLQLRQCLQRRDHLWTQSLILEGLRGVLAHPLPRLLMPEERAYRLRIYFRRSLAGIRPAVLNAEWILPMAGVVIGLPRAESNLIYLSPLLLQLAVAFLTLFLVLVVLQFSSLRYLRKTYDKLELALADWTQEAKLSNVMFDRRKLYAHTLLYEAQPWFHKPGLLKPTKP